jgi:cyclic 2,3-diphosphoglycerate synthetase
MTLADERPSAIALIDGEHYPPVVREALEGLSARYKLVAALFLGGREKLRHGQDISPEAEYGVPVFSTGGDAAATAGAAAGALSPSPEAVAGPADRDTGAAYSPASGRIPALAAGNELLAALMQLVRALGAEAVVDLSDEPVVGYRERLRLASAALAVGARYVGADFELAPQRCAALHVPAISVIGTGKRVGKTAVSGRLARDLRATATGDDHVVIIAMGRGGPPEPELICGAGGVDAADLLAASRRGRHAASDHYEDAALAGVTTIGSRRCGSGLAGTPFDSNVADAFRLLETVPVELVVLEGSGSVIPPAQADAIVCVAGATQPLDYIAGYLGTLRLLLSDLIVLTMCEPPFASAAHVRTLKREVAAVRPDLRVVQTVFRPRPLGDLRGRRVAFFTTAAPQGLPLLSEHLQDAYGADVVLASGSLASRPALVEAVGRATREADVWLTEIKAAAIDVVAEAASREGKELVFCDNEPVPVDGSDLAAAGIALAALARGRFAERQTST